MMNLLALGLLQTGALTVLIEGGSPADAQALAKYLGRSYSVVRETGRKIEVVSGKWPANPGEMRGIDLMVLHVPDPATYAANPNRYVPQLKAAFAADDKRFRAGVTHFRQFVRVPPVPSPAMAEEVNTYLAPLTRQAAREAARDYGVGLIEIPAGTSFVEAVGDVVLDPRVEKQGWHLVSADSEETDEGPAAAAIDGNPDTYWHTRYDPTVAKYPHTLTVDMGKTENLEGFRYLPRQDGGVNGRVKGYDFFLSTDGQTWTAPIVSGEFPNTSNATRVKFPHAVSARYFRFVARSEQSGGPWATAAEIDVLRVRQ